jgi:hypothetical protein
LKTLIDIQVEVKEQNKLMLEFFQNDLKRIPLAEMQYNDLDMEKKINDEDQLRDFDNQLKNKNFMKKQVNKNNL